MMPVQYENDKRKLVVSIVLITDNRKYKLWTYVLKTFIQVSYWSGCKVENFTKPRITAWLLLQNYQILEVSDWHTM